jgi:transposase
MNKKPPSGTDARVAEVANLLKMLVAIEIYRGGMSKENIGKRLHVQKSTVVDILKGFKIVPNKDPKEKKGAN